MLVWYGDVSIEHATPSHFGIGKAYGLPSSALSYGTKWASARHYALMF